MMKWTLLVFAAVISSSRGQNFKNWCPNISNDTAKCANQYLGSLQGIASQSFDPGQLFNIQDEVSGGMCHSSARAAFQSFIDCVNGKIWPCIPSAWRKAFPNVDSIKRSFNYMCDNINDVNTTCLASLNTRFTFSICLVEASGAPGDLSAEDAFLSYTCSLRSKINPCIDTAYGGCKQRTAEVLKKACEYQIPVGCDACMGKPSLILLITFLVLFFLN